MRQILFFSALLSISLFLGCRHGQPTDSIHRSAKFQVTIENVSMAYTYTGSGFFNTPVGAAGPAPIGPGESYEFMFDAAPGSRLSLATMFVHSNDFFYAPGTMGIELFNGTTQVTGEVTSQIMLWDAGTEVNQEPGVGADQAPHQTGPNTGAPDPDNSVRMAMDTYGNLPAVTDVIKVTLSSTSPTGFKATIMNVSNASTLNSSMGIIGAVPLAPGVFVVHSGDNPLFTDGQPDGGKGLEGLAEDGDPGTLHAYLDMHSGVTQILAPGVWTVHKENNILFTPNEQDMGEGLEALAEDGDPGMLSARHSRKRWF